MSRQEKKAAGKIVQFPQRRPPYKWDGDLPLRAKAVLDLFWLVAGRTRRVWMRRREAADRLSLSEKTVTRAVRDAEAAGYLSAEDHGRRGWRIVLHGERLAEGERRPRAPRLRAVKADPQLDLFSAAAPVDNLPAEEGKEGQKVTESRERGTESPSCGKPAGPKPKPGAGIRAVSPILDLERTLRDRSGSADRKNHRRRAPPVDKPGAKARGKNQRIGGKAHQTRRESQEGGKVSGKTHIQWTDASWNCVIGCSAVSEGCRFCYAERMAHRLGANPRTPEYKGLTVVRDSGPKWTGKVRCLPERLEDPLRWKKPRMIFVNSMSDLFHEDVPFDFIDKVFAVMALAPQRIFQVLTKRPERMREYFNRPELYDRTLREADTFRAEWANKRPLARIPISNPATSPLPNVWLGVSAEDQKRAEERIPLLLQTPAAVRFVSLEPLLGPVDLSYRPRLGKLNWVIVGGESGPGARPMNPKWARDIRDQCKAAGVPFFFKQWGEWGDPIQLPPRINYTRIESFHFENTELTGNPVHPKRLTGGTAHTMFRVGKKAAGRLLDGVEHNEFPGGGEMAGRRRVPAEGG